MTTPSSSPYSAELSLALGVIHAASLLTKSVLRSLSNHVSAETKPDDSPVTIADFAAQAIIIAAIHAVYPSDSFIGEESADALRKNDDLAQQVWQLVQHASSASASLRAQSGDVQHVPGHEDASASSSSSSSSLTLPSLTFPATQAAMLDTIDLGTGTSTGPGTGRVWVLDPIDGTATFMKGQQYAVCLCLLIDGVQQLTAIGCPNLDFNTTSLPLPLGTSIHEDVVDSDGYGVVLSAVKTRGTHIRSMHHATLGEPRSIELPLGRENQPPKPLTDLNFIESALGKTSLSQAEHRAVAESLGVASSSWPGTVIWSQQIKYVALSLGATDVMLRLPKDKQRFTCTWDHAGGQLLFTEAGGIIKDIEGGAIDFTQGRKILGHGNFGMVAAMPWCFDQVMQAVQEVLEKRT